MKNILVTETQMLSNNAINKEDNLDNAGTQFSTLSIY